MKHMSQTPPLPHWLSVGVLMQKAGCAVQPRVKGRECLVLQMVAPRSRQRLVEASSGQELNNLGSSGESLPTHKSYNARIHKV